MVGRTSIEVELRVEAEHLLTGEITHTNSAYFVYVALDEARKPTRVPELLLQTAEEQQRFAAGKQRQARRAWPGGRIGNWLSDNGDPGPR